MKSILVFVGKAITSTRMQLGKNFKSLKMGSFFVIRSISALLKDTKPFFSEILNLLKCEKPLFNNQSTEYYRKILIIRGMPILNMHGIYSIYISVTISEGINSPIFKYFVVRREEIPLHFLIYLLLK